jgi:hypothetical protein
MPRHNPDIRATASKPSSCRFARPTLLRCSLQSKRIISTLIITTILCPGIALAKSHKAKSHSGKALHVKAKKSKKGGWRKHGQQAINEDRTREIQEALIREHYLDGEATGVLDQRTKAALVRLQAENHWQTKIVPDSRALIRLGLGPKHEGVLNPETAAINTSMGASQPNQQ